MLEDDTITIEQLTLVDGDEPSFDPRNSGVSPILTEEAMRQYRVNKALKNTK